MGNDARKIWQRYAVKKLLGWPFRLLGWVLIVLAAAALLGLLEAKVDHPLQSHDMTASILSVASLLFFAGVLLIARSRPRR